MGSTGSTVVEILVMWVPNKRLKLPGGDRFKGSGVLCAGAHELSFNYIARGGRVARSLSAVRWAAAQPPKVETLH